MWQYACLGVIFYVTGLDDREITRRILQASKIVRCLSRIWWSKDIGKKRKCNIYDALVKSSILYGAHTWLVNERNKKKN